MENCRVSLGAVCMYVYSFSVYSRSPRTTALSCPVERRSQDGIIVWDHDAHAERAQAEKEHEPPDERRKGLAHDSSGPFGFASCHGDVFRSDHAGFMSRKKENKRVKMNSYVKDAWIMQLNTPRKRPVFPGTRCETNAPWKGKFVSRGFLFDSPFIFPFKSIY
jgi:hypothetical protein